MLRQVKLRFWLPLQHIRYEKSDAGGNGQNQQTAGRDQPRQISFCVGFQCPRSGQVKLVRFYQEMTVVQLDGQKTASHLNFRPYFPTKEKVLEHMSYFSNDLAMLLYRDDKFNSQNPLVRILRLASFDIDKLALDPSFYKHPF